MPDPETLLAEAFGFGLFEHVEALQKQIDDTLERYGDSDLAPLSMDELDNVAGGNGLKCTQPQQSIGGGHIHIDIASINPICNPDNIPYATVKK